MFWKAFVKIIDNENIFKLGAECGKSVIVTSPISTTSDCFFNYDLLSKLVQLTKNYNHSTKHWWDLYPGPGNIGLILC